MYHRQRQAAGARGHSRNPIWNFDSIAAVASRLYLRLTFAIAVPLFGLALGTWVENSNVLLETARLAKYPVQDHVKAILVSSPWDPTKWTAAPASISGRLLTALEQPRLRYPADQAEANAILKISFLNGSSAILPVEVLRNKIYLIDYGASWFATSGGWAPYGTNCYEVPVRRLTRKQLAWLRKASKSG
jgi:hypothetical protein